MLTGEHPAPELQDQSHGRSAGRPNYEGLASDGTKSKAITVQLKCKGADSIDLIHHGEVVATMKGDDGTLKVATHRLGGGPLRFTPVANFAKQKVQGFSTVDKQ